MSTDAVIVGVLGLFSTVLTFIFSRGKEKADVTGTIADAAEVSVGTLLKVMEELKASMDDIKSTNDLLKCEIDKLIDENVLLMSEINELKIQNQELLAENIKLRKEIHSLSKKMG